METRKIVELKPFLSLRDAATYTGLSYNYLRAGCNNGTIPHVKSGKKIFVNMNRLMDQMDAFPSEKLQTYST